MNENGIFVFGSKIFKNETKRDSISLLPLELSWKIFSYLDATSLRAATHSHKPWSRIILANKKLRNRLNKFELAIKLGSESLARFYRKNKRKLKREMATPRHFLPRGANTVQSTEVTIYKRKRGGEDLVIYTKRYKLR